MGARSSATNTVLLDAAAITATGAQSPTSFFPPYNKNPRFQLLVANFTGLGPVEIKLEHSEILNQWTDLTVANIMVEANGLIAIRTEDLVTQFPFTRVRANIVSLGGATLTATLVGVCDKRA